jgi:hypothetical protein
VIVGNFKKKAGAIETNWLKSITLLECKTVSLGMQQKTEV